VKLASRLGFIEPFYVMECAKTADEIARSPASDPTRGGRPMIYLNIGEPDFGAPAAVVQAAQAALAAGRTAYTPAAGLPALREAIAQWTQQRWGVAVDPARVVVTAGASAALQLVTMALFQTGDDVLMPDPCYPCNRHFVAATGARPRLLATGPAQRFQLDAESVAAAWSPATRGVLLASPSNPTGTSIAPAEMARIAQVVRSRRGALLVDEIYLGLNFEERFDHSALELGEDLIVVNSFSKTFCMTGWRLGWLVLPPALVAPVERLAQNLYICPPALAQHAALACFTPEALAESEARRVEFRQRRDLVVPSLQALGLEVPVLPDGAFYAWADCTRHLRKGRETSWAFCFEMMHRAQVALTPGRDFGPAAADRCFRLSFANSRPALEAALQRLQQALAS